jgi:hypothetical protein
VVVGQHLARQGPERASHGTRSKPPGTAANCSATSPQPLTSDAAAATLETFFHLADTANVPELSRGEAAMDIGTARCGSSRSQDC